MELKRIIQVFLLVALVLAAVRVGIIYYGRHAAAESSKQQKAANAPLNPDYYVTPKKLNAYDVQSAKELIKQPVWVRAGYHYAYFAYDGHTASGKEVGKFGPLEKLKVVDVVLERAPSETMSTPSGAKVKVSQDAINVIFEKDGRRFSFPIGLMRGSEVQIFADDMLFLQDPHDLYKHWPSDVWQSVDQHQIKSGMSELQTSFAVGVGYLDRGAPLEPRQLTYPNGGHPLVVTFRDGKVSEVKSGGSDAQPAS